MINIAIDGPAGAGKSTVAKAVAGKLGLIYLDTGAMYRATAYYALENGADVTDENAVKPLLDNMNMEISYLDGVQQIYVNGKNVTPYLREHYMSKAASDISALPAVRYKMVDLQRQFAATRDVALDGRDIGTFVLPNANFKFYLTATPEERAKRRYLELEQRGQKVDFDELLNDIIRRDYNDSHREVAPLKQADDAIYLDTTNMAVQEVIDFVIKTVCGDDLPPDTTQPDDKNQPITLPETDKNQSIVSPESVANAAGANNAGAKNSSCVKDDKQEAKSQDAKLDKKAEKAARQMKKYYQPPKHWGLYHFLRIFLKPVQVCLFPVEIVNADKAINVSGRAIYICNHYSKADTFAAYFNLFKGEAYTLAKAELFESPISAWFLHSMGAIPVKRGEADIDSAKAVLRLLKDDKKLLIFPEGTRNKEGGENMSEFKQGVARYAIKTQSPVVPMIYYEKPHIFRKNYLYVGDPISLEEYYDRNIKECAAQATDLLRGKMYELRDKVNEYAAAKRNRKAK